MALINLTGYKIYAGIKSNNYDDELNTLIPMAIQFARNYCRKTFDLYVTDPAVELVDGGTNMLLLTESPLIDVVSVEYSEDYGQTFTALTEYEDWVQIEDGIQSTSEQGFPNKLNGYRITYKAGYSQTPADLELALFELVSYFRKNDNALHAPRTVGSSSNAIEYVTANKLPTNIQMVLDFYKADYL